jgi:hypothetical protein
MKILVTLLGLLNGGYMLFDGLHVMLKGKYFGPEKPGPWAELFYRLQVDVFRLGGLFVGFGLLWLVWLYALWTAKSWAYVYGLAISGLTLWYLPVGTVFSLAILGSLVWGRQKVGV